MNNFNSSHKKVFEYYITWLFYFWIWRRCHFEICMVLALGSPPPGPPWGPHVPYEHLWIPGPWGWFLPSLVKIQPCISSRSRWTVTFYIGPPPQPVTPAPTGAIGATLGTATNNLYSSPKKVSTLYITWLFYLNWIWRRSLKFAKFWPFGALPLGPP